MYMVFLCFIFLGMPNCNKFTQWYLQCETILFFILINCKELEGMIIKKFNLSILNYQIVVILQPKDNK